LRCGFADPVARGRFFSAESAIALLQQLHVDQL